MTEHNDDLDIGLPVKWSRSPLNHRQRAPKGKRRRWRKIRAQVRAHRRRNLSRMRDFRKKQLSSIQIDRNLTKSEKSFFITGRGPNPHFDYTHPKIVGKVTVELPPQMDFMSNRGVTIDALHELRKASFESLHHGVFVDLEKLTDISPEAAVALVAELKRCMSLARLRHFSGNWPDAKCECAQTLAGLGAFKLLGIPDRDDVELSKTKKWFQIFSDTVVPTVEIYELLQHYKSNFNLDETDRQKWESRFYRALSDASHNVIDHAYPRQRSRQPYLFRQWWMAGVVDRSSETLTFIMWDQGVGIPRTIGRKKSFIPFLAKRENRDSARIDAAMERGASRYKSKRRGKGLRALIELIDLAPDGNLRILSGAGSYRYQKDEPLQLDDHEASIGGTLISWTVGYHERK